MKRKVKNMVRRILRKCYRLLLLVIYRPKKKWEKEYVENLYAFATCGVWHRLKRNFLAFLEEREDLLKYPWSKAWRVFDFWLCVIFIGAEENDYFGIRQLYKSGWKVRKHCVTQQRMNFIKARLNRGELRCMLEEKSRFAKIWPSYFDRKWVSFPNCSKEQFCELFRTLDRIIVKPEQAYGGKGIFVIDLEGKGLEEVFYSLQARKEKLIVEEYIHQTGFLHDCNPSSLNTIRVITLRLKDEMFVIPASYLRVGGKDAVVDNHSSGGIVFDIDVKTGVLSWGHRMNTRERYSAHPATGVQIEGHRIEQWDKVLQFCKEAHLLAPAGLDFIGWDVSVCDERLLLIEGNDGPGFGMPINEDTDIWGAIKEYLNLREESETNGDNSTE